jgi:hypothetical protein
MIRGFFRKAEIDLDVTTQPFRNRIFEQTRRENPDLRKPGTGTCHSTIFRDAGSCSDLKSLFSNFFQSKTSLGIV